MPLWILATNGIHWANGVYHRLVEARTPLVVTTAILLECGNAAARMPYRIEIECLRTHFERAGLLISVEDDDWREAWNAYAKGEADNDGIVHHISFTVMRRLSLTQAFTKDQHFRAAGFETLF